MYLFSILQNNIGDEGAKAIAQCLIFNSTLVELK
jgi:hypothetical protein